MLDMGGATKFGEGAELPISRTFGDHPCIRGAAL
jgi:hypothetical protein